MAHTTRLVTGGQVARAATDTLKTHLGAVLSQAAAADGHPADHWPAPAASSWTRVTDLLNPALGPRLPACYVAPDGVAAYERIDSATSDVIWRLRVWVVVRGPSFEETLDRVAVYTDAVAAVLAANPTLGGLATWTRPVDSAYAELDADKSRTLAGGLHRARVRVPAALVVSPSGPAMATTPVETTPLRDL